MKVDYIQPCFDMHLPRSIVDRVARQTFPGPAVNPLKPDVNLSDAQFVSPFFEVVGVESPYKADVVYLCDNVKAPWNYKVGDEATLFAQHPLIPHQRELRRYRIIEEHTSVADTWLAASIREGRTPRALDQTFMTVDFRSVSALTALELGASLWKTPDLDRMVAPLGMISPDEADRHPIPFSKRVPFHTAEQADAVNEYLEFVQQAIHGMRTRFPENLALVKGLLPLNTMVSTTVTKTISEWRHWITSDSQSYEAYWLKVQLFRQADRLASCLFVGCEIVVDAFDKYEAQLKESRT